VRRGRFEIASEVFPVRYVSGDFYDVLDLGTHTGLVVGDIAGKGLSAGLWLTHVVGLIRIHASAHPEPSAALAAVNRDLYRLQPEPPMASLFFARLNPSTGELLYSNAGQPPAQLLRRDARVESLQEGGPLLGALPEATFNCGRVVMEPGETLIAYSDGIIECSNARDEEFGLARLLAAACSSNGVSASAMLFSILGAVQDFAGRCPRHDDFTLMVARHMGGLPRR